MAASDGEVDGNQVSSTGENWNCVAVKGGNCEHNSLALFHIILFVGFTSFECSFRNLGYYIPNQTCRSMAQAGFKPTVQCSQ